MPCAGCMWLLRLCHLDNSFCYVAAVAASIWACRLHGDLSGPYLLSDPQAVYKYRRTWSVFLGYAVYACGSLTAQARIWLTPAWASAQLRRAFAIPFIGGPQIASAPEQVSLMVVCRPQAPNALQTQCLMLRVLDGLQMPSLAKTLCQPDHAENQFSQNVLDCCDI